MIPYDLSGRVAVVTGASRGLGAALARGFALAGVDLAICARTAGVLDSTREAVAVAGRECLAMGCDIRLYSEVRRFAEATLERFGRVDALVNNAALLGPRVPLAEFPVEEWRPVLGTNVDGTFHVTRSFLPAMLRARNGSIITVTSGVGNVGRSDWGAYGVSKFAQEGLALGLAVELEGTGVRSNLVDPGPMRTEMRAAAYPQEDPRRPRAPEELLEVFLYLASDASRGINGRRFRAWEFAAGGA